MTLRGIFVEYRVAVNTSSWSIRARRSSHRLEVLLDKAHDPSPGARDGKASDDGSPEANGSSAADPANDPVQAALI